MIPSQSQRGTVSIKPVYLGLHHYTDVYGSSCIPLLVKPLTERSFRAMLAVLG